MSDFLIVAGEPRRLEALDDLRSPQLAPLEGGGTAALAVSLDAETSRRTPVVTVLGPDGTPLTPGLELERGPKFTRIDPEIAALPDGGFAVSWLSADEAGAEVMLMQTFDAAGRPEGDPLTVFGSVGQYEYDWTTSMAATSNGLAVLTYDTDWSLDWDEWGRVELQLFDADGAPLGAPRELLPGERTTAAALRAGPEGALAVEVNFDDWETPRSVLRLDPAGEPDGPWREVDPRDEHGLADWLFTMEPLVEGRSLITFDVDRVVFAAMLSEEGRLEALPARLGEGHQWGIRWSSVAALPDGEGAVVLWERASYYDHIPPTYLLQRLDPDGAPVGDLASFAPPGEGADSFRLQGVHAVAPGEIEVLWTARDGGERRHFTQTLLTEEAPGATAGSTGDDVLSGTSGDDVLAALAGDDVVRGHGGSDEMSGGLGDDRMLGGAGADRLGGGSGEDILHGQGGDDRLLGDAGMDRLYGGAGDDRLAGGGGDDRLKGGAGDDVILWGGGFDRAWGGDGADRFVFASSDVLDWGFGEAERDRVRILDFDAEADTIVVDAEWFWYLDDPAEIPPENIIVREDRTIIELDWWDFEIQIEGATDAGAIAAAIELV